MKKYHLADVLTWSRLCCGLVLLLGSFTTWLSATGAFALFAFGELADAFDGILARRWPYPDDGKYRWWRAYIKLIEPVFDIFLGVSALIYIALRFDLVLGLSILFVSVTIGVSIQVAAYGGIFHTIATARPWGLLRTNPALASAIILFRRNILYASVIAYILLFLLWHSDLAPELKIAFTVVGLHIGAELWGLKTDRRTEVETY